MLNHRGFAVSAVVGLVALMAVASAYAHGVGGGSDIANAPVIPLDQPVQGTLFSGNFHDGYDAEFFKVNFEAGDHVQIRVQSVGQEAPCPVVYLPGTDDFNFNYDQNQVQANWNVNGSHFLSTFIAGHTGTYVIGMNDLFDQCYEDPAQWAYSFTVLAPHGLRIALPAGHLVHGVNRINVSIRDAFADPVTDPSLAVSLTEKIPGVPPQSVGQQPVKNGVATFTLTLPQRAHSAVLTATAGDNVKWVSAGSSRRYGIR